jgi:tetratricopeptide (TPR) repeat protein
MQYLLVAAATGSLFLAGAAQAQIVSMFGGNAARSCYEAAGGPLTDRASIKICNQALATASSLEERVATLINRGIVYRYAGDHVSALRDFDEAMALDPSQPDSYLNKSLLLMRLGGADRDVITLSNSALAKNTRKPALAYYARAMANEGLGNVAAAYADYKRAARLAPDWSMPTAELKRFTSSKS